MSSLIDVEGLDWLVTDASYEGQGAGTALLDWGLEKAGAEKMAIHLESTMEGMDFYTNRGFRRVSDIKIALRGDGEDMYQEVGLLWEP